MASGQSKIELVLDLKNKVGMGLTQAKKQINSETSQMQARLNEFSASATRDFKSISSEIPVLNNGLRLMANPIVAAGSGITALAAGFTKATSRAADFNHEFRGLANLNLDKPQEELTRLREITLDTAYKKGFNPENTVNAFNELQSTAGIYGDAARPIVEKQGEFASLLKTSMDDYVAGTAKAMVNWRIGVDKLDDFNKSNYAAMQVGKVEFNELAKLQSVFAGSAASINQSFDTANKLFSMFTIKTGSVAEAATQTKSLFNDLTKASTIKAFKRVGIDMFDANKQLKQADVIMLELNDKFMKMKDDKAIVNLKNQFTGSEGLIAMIQAATDKTGGLRDMLKEFQDSRYNADMALSQAHNDFLERQKELSNRIDALMVRLGNKFLPHALSLMDIADKVVSRAAWNSKSEGEKQQALINSQRADVYEKYGNLTSGLDSLNNAQFQNRMDYIQKRQNEHYNTFDSITESYRKSANWGQDPAKRVEHLDFENNYDRFNFLGRAKAFEKLGEDLKKAWNNKALPAPTTPPNTSETTNNGDISGISNSIDRVTGSAQAPRNITVNIDAFNKGGINTQNTSLQNMDAKQIEDWFVDMCYRAIRNVELGYN
ncbi:phage tail tape measure protein [Dysgonomonas termitidis]|uniref:Phage tail tape measure protein n=1 Tax=Dysgonomonas termitidis TaxID=1516126 RepID=A0ABV9KS33_9BACT